VSLPEPSQADVRELLRPERLLAALGWQGPEEDLGRAIAHNVQSEGQESGWRWPPSSASAPPAVAFLLPGLPREGSGGSHSLVQEARGMWALGAATRICVPDEALATARALYGNDDELFVAYHEDDAIGEAIGAADVVVCTEHTSIPLAERLARERPDLTHAYYVQDYEPLFAPFGAARSDRAVLSYRAIPGQVLYAKTDWLRNVVMALHGVPVMKVEPSLDRSLFHARGRPAHGGVLRVVAMVRPRTPRRRARATLMTLEAIARARGAEVEALAFGCEAGEFAELHAESTRAEGTEAENTQADVAHLGLLTRAEVAEVMRRADVFIDASAYQAFGRTGLEAMACGAVPVLPALGGVGEYATHDRDAVIFTDDDPQALAREVSALLDDRERLERLRAAGVKRAEGFSIERAARSQMGLFAALTTRPAPRVTVARR
jgi:Glycosyl transferases group 1